MFNQSTIKLYKLCANLIKNRQTYSTSSRVKAKLSQTKFDYKEYK